MQVFMPFPDFKKSVECLDRKRLCKQRVECKQIYRALTVPGYSWSNHPITRMFRGHEYSLLTYAIAACRDWTSRGYSDSLWTEFLTLIELHENTGDPKWLGDMRVHRSHQSNLLRKDPSFYGRYNWNVSPDLEYFWAL